MNFQYLKQDYDIAASVMAIFVMLLIFIYILISLVIPQFIKYEESANNLKHAQHDYTRLTQIKIKIDKVSMAHAAIERMSQRISESPSSINISSLLSASADNNDMTILSESYKTSEESETTRIKIELKGGYRQLREMINEIVDSNYFVVFEEISIDSKANKDLIAKMIITINNGGEW